MDRKSKTVITVSWDFVVMYIEKNVLWITETSLSWYDLLIYQLSRISNKIPWCNSCLVVCVSDWSNVNFYLYKLIAPHYADGKWPLWRLELPFNRGYHQLINIWFRLTHHKHQISTLLSLCEGNPPITGGFPTQRNIKAEKCFHLMTWQWWGIMTLLMITSRDYLWKKTC